MKEGGFLIKIDSDVLDIKIQNEICTLFKTIAYPVRIQILNLLSTGSYTVMEISDFMNMTQRAISHQLKPLRESQLIKFKKVGKQKYYELADEHIYEIYNLAIQHVKEEKRYEQA